ncbi:DNA polymerase I [Pseudoroseomonas ludipueritiae]|uniref:DNA polymerase I n=1 Tax=Pseudoroseomonas ludipueritiae TaxID=198093 RepID=A0ABR7RBB5_9PROT|nr:DNA polymerase I [Pseudoroseomonas ludipueritiae]MBC9178998.1 DNA polymerase I [Pseudoroseomonas ludipueritiae]
MAITKGAAGPADLPAEVVRQDKPHLILVDGSGYIFRAFHALPPMTRPDGVPVNAVFGFTSMLGNFLTKHAGSHIAVVFDRSRVTFRNQIYADYKAHRPEPPPELVPQFALIREATAAFGVACLELENYEADDLIAAYAKAFSAEGGQVTVVSSDKDLMQLVGPNVQLLDPIKQKPIREPEVFEKFGVTPDKVVEVQALAGDSTDNVPGVPGIGLKTAAQLIQEYGDLENLLNCAGQIKQPKRRESLQNFAEQARISRQLVLLDADAPLPRPIDELLAQPPEPGKLAVFLRDQGFRSLLHRMGLEGDSGTPATSQPRHAPQVVAQAEPVGTPPEDAPAFGPYETVTDLDSLNRWVEEARAAGTVALDTETDSLDALHAKLVGISLAIAPGRACYIPLGHGPKPGNGDMLEAAPEAPVQIPLREALSALQPLLEDPGTLKVLHNAKYDLEVLGRPQAEGANSGIEVAPVDDTMLISYSMDAGRHGHGMDELSLRHLGHSPIPYDQVTGTGRNRIPFSQVELEKATAYAAEDADVTLRLWQMLKPRLRTDKSLALYEQIERRMIGVLKQMEMEGIRVDGVELARIGEDFSQRMVTLEQKIYELAGRAFNVGSPKQLGEILFDEMKLPGGKRGKAGAWGTDAAVLEDLSARGHELPKTVLHWRQLSKLKSTYVEGLAAQLDPRDGRVHTDFSMAITSTGRLSSTEPNLQNIPIRTEEGVRIRRAFVASPGHVLLAADYSQIELRLLAHLADVPSLRDAFEKDEDIHSRTAADIFKLEPDKVDREARRRAKTINFGIIYGMSAFGLAARLGIGPGEAKGIIDAYFAQYPGIRAEMERLKEEARINGFVLTPFGRKLWIDGITSKDMSRRGNAERAAINAPFQGGAAEIIKRAMVRMPKALKDAGLDAKMLLQVHDELLFEVPQGQLTATSALVKQVMESVAELRVPLRAEIGHGANWAEAH